MNTLYLDIFSGISGDMFLGAMIDLGVDPGDLEKELGKMKLEGYHLHVSRQERGAIAGTKFDVHVEELEPHPHDHDHSHYPHHHHAHGEEKDGHTHEHHHDPPGQSHSHEHDHGDGHSHGHSHGQEHEHGRNFSEIRRLIEGSDLSSWVKEKAVAVFERVAVAEGKIHGRPPQEVHFHEVGAVDSIVDIVGACVALERLGKPRVFSGSVVEGQGTVRCAHGQFPLPAPATLEILSARGVGIKQCEEPHELMTPTGAALLAEFAETFGPMTDLVVEKIGYGLGTRENKTRPNVLRAVLGRSVAGRLHDWETDTVVVLETNLDDIKGELLGNFMESALKAGALDVVQVPIQMKKNRPGIMLSLLCCPEDADRLTELILTETTAFGVRCSTWDRRKLRREIISVQTSYGRVEVKVGRLDGRVVQVSPEYESCRALAAAAGVPLKRVYEAAVQEIT